MNIDSPTFCVLPFIHKHKRLAGIETLCCHSQTPIDDIKIIRQKLINGERVNNCETCYKLEDNGFASHRIKENNRWLLDPDVKEYINTYIPDSEEITFSYDLRYSNICNLACIGCMPQQSSLWAKELHLQIKPINFKFDLDKATKAKWIYLAGGEPFLTDELIALLKQISDLDVQPLVCINTNLTIQDDDIKKICENIHNLTLQISIDGVGKVAEYHRWPLKWEKFKRNLEWARELNCNIVFNTVVDAVNVGFIDQILEYEDYPSTWILTPLLTPVALQVEHLPDRLKQQAHDNFIKLKKSKHYVNDINFKTNADSILNKITKDGDPSKLSQFIQRLDKRRNINHTEFLGIDLK
jgi:sulfatase maturation enzyme AslB (radical SAM superfamily)